MKIYDVGGFVRDSIMGIPSKDRDFVVVTDFLSVEFAWRHMKSYLEDEKVKIFLETPECYTIRGIHPEYGVADWVLARKEIGYTPGSRKPILVPGSLYDDLQRRDFTCNAMARDLDGNLIDPFNGQQDIKNKILRCPLHPYVTLMDDPLRALRAIRFSVKLNFTMEMQLFRAIGYPDVLEKMKLTVSPERIADELSKSFAADTMKTWKLLSQFEDDFIEYCITAGGMHLQPTFKILK